VKIAALFIAFIALLLPASSSARAQQPNIVLVQVDDLSEKVLKTALADGQLAMPYLQKQINTGSFLPKTHNSTPLCAPSRAALLSGQFAHNNEIIANGGRYGGWRGWQRSPILANNLATELQKAGYYTAHFGKWTNGYDLNSDLPVYVPPGWSAWFSDAEELSNSGFYGYRQIIDLPRENRREEISARRGNRNYSYNQGIDAKSCRVRSWRGCFYHSDMISRQAVREVEQEPGPLFLHLDYHSPHADGVSPLGPQPATRHIGLARNVSLPRDPAVNERNTSDKDYLIRRNNGLLPRHKMRVIKNSYRSALESMRSVDEGLAAISAALEQRGELDNTYFFFVVDNGYFYGEHRFRSGKGLPYRNSATVPSVIWGPNILRQKYRGDVSTTDIAPTIISLAGAENSLPVDGMDLSPLLTQGIKPERRAILSERISADEFEGKKLPFIRPVPLSPRRPADKAPNVYYRSLKIGRYRYINYIQGGEELYDLRQDPYQLYNQAKNKKFKKHLLHMRAELKRYRNCQQQECLARPRPVPRRQEIKSDALPPGGKINHSQALLWKNKLYFKSPCRCRVKVYYRSTLLATGPASRSGALAVLPGKRISALRAAEQKRLITIVAGQQKLTRQLAVRGPKVSYKLSLSKSWLGQILRISHWPSQVVDLFRGSSVNDGKRW